VRAGKIMASVSPADRTKVFVSLSRSLRTWYNAGRRIKCERRNYCMCCRRPIVLKSSLRKSFAFRLDNRNNNIIIVWRFTWTATSVTTDLFREAKIQRVRVMMLKSVELQGWACTQNGIKSGCALTVSSFQWTIPLCGIVRKYRSDCAQQMNRDMM